MRKDIVVPKSLVWFLRMSRKQSDRDWKYRRKFGASMMEQFGVDGIEGYEFLCNRQNRTCPLCNKTEDESLHEAAENRKRKGLPPAKYPMPAFVHDHCHKTNKVRWLICSGCNTMIGGYEKASLQLGEETIREYLNA